MESSVRDDVDALTALAEEWRALWAEDPAATLFHTPEYADAYRLALGNDARILSIAIRREGALAGLVTVAVKDEVLGFLGDADVSDYLGPIARPADRDDVAAALVDGIVETGGWHTAVLQGLAADSGWPDALARAAKAAGLLVEEEQQDLCPRVTLPGSYEGYLATLDGKLRHEIRRKARRLERDAGPARIRLSTRETLDDDLARFFELHRSSEGPKGRFLHWGMEGMFTLLARRFEESGWLRLVWLDLGGVPVAAVFGFAARGVWSVYNSAYDHERRALSPGMVLVAETIRLAAEDGCTTFDFLRGAEAYKYRFGATDIPLVQLTLRAERPVTGRG